MSRLYLTAALGLAVALPAHAHVSIAEDGAAPGDRTKVTLRVPHGCDGSATTSIRVGLPEGFNDAKPMPKGGWDVATEDAAIIWSGGELADAHDDEFVLRGMVDDDATAGDALYFPVEQTCTEGATAWTAVDGSEGDGPAPSLRLVAAGGTDHDHGAARAGTVTVGDLEITRAFARATLPNQPVAGAFMTVTNSGEVDDALVSVTSPAAGRVELHEMSNDRGVMRMRALSDGLLVPAGGTLTLEPGGYHMMFTDLTGPLEAGTTAEVTVTFAGAGEVTLPLPVRERDAAAEMGGMTHDQSHDHGEE